MSSVVVVAVIPLDLEKDVAKSLTSQQPGTGRFAAIVA
jgi:hypothetical protein